MMRKKKLNILIISIISAILLAACSTTKNLPEGELLYTGQLPMVIKNDTATSVGETAIEEVEAALATAPNNSFMGSSSIRTPLPFGLWFYNAFSKSEKGIGKWIFNHFAADPVLLSNVNPDIRVQAARNILRDYGYFNGSIKYDTIHDKKDSLKVKIKYTVDMQKPYLIDTVLHKDFSRRTLRLIERSYANSMLKSGTQFNVNDLNEERTRISNLLRNTGAYYFRPDYMIFQADTTITEGNHVSLRLVPVDGMPAEAEKTFYIGKTTVNIVGRNGEATNKSLEFRGMTVNYYEDLSVRPKMLNRWMDYKNFRMKRRVNDSTGLSVKDPQSRYSLHGQNRVQERLTDLGMFRYVEMKYVPRDSTYTNDTIDLVTNLMLDKPYSFESDFNVKMKSNNQTGPGASVGLTKNNVFGGGEKWNIKLNGSYEWQTGKNSSSDMNSYEFGLSSSLVFPRILFPRLGKREYDFPATTTLRLSLDQMNRPKYYMMYAMTADATYEFQPRTLYKHSLTPLRLTYNMISKETDAFNELKAQNPALYVSLRDQLIPALEYSVTFDNASRARHPKWWQITFASAGNLLSVINKIGGKDFGERGKEILGVPFAQFLKINSEFRYHYNINEDNQIAARVAGGIVWSYGNSTTAPYTEQFYIGGANSVRAFSARNIGPGGLTPDKDNKYSFINHVGDLRFEANLEYRFRIVNDFHGALFLDAGNVWLLRKDEARPDAQFKIKNFFKQTALGTGVGVRYDMDFLVFRLDLGIGIHNPYETGKSGYYNIPKFKDGMALHFAIGYPF